jgi:hypothetical protein
MTKALNELREELLSQGWRLVGQGPHPWSLGYARPGLDSAGSTTEPTKNRHGYRTGSGWVLAAVAGAGMEREATMATFIILVLGALLLLAGAAYVLVARPWINRWGATDQEHQAAWPGDQLVDRPRFVWTNAITIRAPAAQVWPWLVQLGQGRGGLYSYDWLENLIGCDVHSTDRILPERQTSLQVGDRLIRMARYAPCNPVALFEPQRALVLGHVKDTYAELAAGHARSSWAFLLQPIDRDSTRLLVRCRGNSLMARLQGPVQFVMQRKMMLGIKQRAERQRVAVPDRRRPAAAAVPPGAPQPPSSDVVDSQGGVRRTLVGPRVGGQRRP